MVSNVQQCYTQMDKYQKGHIIELPEDLPFAKEHNAVVMRVKPSTKLSNINNYAGRVLQAEESRSIIFSGIGQACTKVVSCVEVFKRTHSAMQLSQITKVKFVRVEEYWEPLDDNLERLKVNRDIPAIYVLLSKDLLDSTEPGHQSTEKSTAKSARKSERFRRNNQGLRNIWKRPDRSRPTHNNNKSSKPPDNTDA